MDDADRMRATSSHRRPRERAQADSLVPAGSRVLPAADWSATPRRFHGYRGHTTPLRARRAQPANRVRSSAPTGRSWPRGPGALMGTSAGRLGGSIRDGQATLLSRHRGLGATRKPRIGPRLVNPALIRSSSSSSEAPSRGSKVGGLRTKPYANGN